MHRSSYTESYLAGLNQFTLLWFVEGVHASLSIAVIALLVLQQLKQKGHSLVIFILAAESNDVLTTRMSDHQDISQCYKALRHLGQSADRSFSVSLALCTCNAWRNVLFHIYRNIGCHFKQSDINMLIVKWKDTSCYKWTVFKDWDLTTLLQIVKMLWNKRFH